MEDWGTGSIDGEQLIDCTTNKEAPDNLGGHATWGGSASKTCASGAHSYGMTAQNITMDDPNQNKFVCTYSFEAVCLEAGGKKPKEPCGCEENTCSPDGGAPPPPQGRARAALPSPAFSASSAGSTVEAGIDENGLLWSCSAANLRGLGAQLPGWLELTAEELTASLSMPSALAFRHPLAAQLTIPEGGLVAGAKLELRLGSRVIAFRCYDDGSILPIGVDTAGLGRATLSVGAAPVYRTTTVTRCNGSGGTYTVHTAELVSEHASLERKTVLTDPRGNVTTHWVEYGSGPVRVRKTALPTSPITAEETIVDGFVVAQSDETGVTVSRMRAFTATGQLFAETDGRSNTTTTTTDLAGRVLLLRPPGKKNRRMGNRHPARALRLR